MQETASLRDTFARLLGFLRPYKVSLIVSIVLAVGSQVAAIALIWLTERVIDEALAAARPRRALDPRGRDRWRSASHARP